MPPKFALSPEQQAAAEAKRALRQAKKAAAPAKPAFTWTEQPFLKRDVHQFQTSASSSTSIATWNILAQALIRRTLFPGCDCLRWSQRSSQLSQVLHYSPSLVALQEVDRVDDHTKFLAHGGYQWIWEKGYKPKQHGLLLAWKEAELQEVQRHWVKLDEAQVQPRRTALSRKTRNIGLCVALQRKETPEKGVILATHHLFWHPSHVYERSRQLGLWMQSIANFRASLPDKTQQSWPVVLAGDFNVQPTELGYWLMCQPDLEPPRQMVEAWEKSRVVHRSMDEAAAAAAAASSSSADAANKEEAEDEEEEEEEEKQGGEEEDPDRILHNCRPATEADALLTFEELRQLFKTLHPRGGLSLYDRQTIPGQDDNIFGTRWAEQTGGWSRPVGREQIGQAPGDGEPKYTNVTPLWRCTLDYIVVYPGRTTEGAKSADGEAESQVQVTSLLKVPRLEELEPGLPRLGTSPSDHLLLMASAMIPGLDLSS